MKCKCKQCAEYVNKESGVKTPAGFFCCFDHAIQFANEKSRKNSDRQAAKERRVQQGKDKEERKALRERKIALRTRNDWFDILQEEVNRYVKLRDHGEPCCTCGTTNPYIKYDAGHYRTRGGVPELRFELTNIHKQCSVNCNQYGSGMRAEYQEFIRNKYGQKHLNWLDGPHPSLKEQFPDIESIKAEIKKFRALNKELKSEIEMENVA